VAGSLRYGQQVALCQHFLVNLNVNNDRKITRKQQRTFLVDLLKLKLVSKSAIDKFSHVASRLWRSLCGNFAESFAPHFEPQETHLVDLDRMSTVRENEFLSSMLNWEKAPVLPISQWFTPELKLASHRTMDDAELAKELDHVIHLLFEKKIALLQSGHLSDRQLYCLIARDILPAEEKMVQLPGHDVLQWQCFNPDDEESWLRFYASDSQRANWAVENNLRLPPKEDLPYPRRLPYSV